MNVKRYFAADMQEVMGKVHEELGPDAVILSSKRMRKKGLKGLFQKPVYEVMVAYDQPVPQRPRTAARPPATPAVKPAVTPAVTLASAGPGGAAVSAAAISSALPAYRRGQGAAPTKKQSGQPPKQAAASPPHAAPAPGPMDIEALLEPLETPSPDEPLAPVSFPKMVVSSVPHPIPLATAEGTEQRIRRMDQEMEEIRRLLSQVAGRIGQPSDDGGVPARFQPYYQHLLRHEVEPDLAARLVREAQMLLFAGQYTQPADALKATLLSYIKQGSGLPMRNGHRRVVLMVGPTGVGKTTSLVKLAAQSVIRDGMSVGMINTDTFRIGAEQQLKTYAEILDAPTHMAYSPQEAADHLARMQDTDLVFIDTPGKRPGDAQHRQEIEQLVKLCKPDAIYLVLSAPTGPQACRRVVEDYSFLSQYELLITKLDETQCAGIALTACEASGRAIAYIASGQSVPDDLSPADPERITLLLAEGDAS